ncbi:MAG: chemotactic signal-response protein chel [Alphaproteobacteria bacterium]|nr:chemotactic signal-response protein chel [Alphaproteobacteria bacterium]
MDNLLDLQMSNAITASSSSDATPRTGQVRTAEEAAAVAEEFEGFFLSQMIQAMFSNVGNENPFGGGAGERAFRGLLHEEYAKVMAEAGGLGLSDRLTAEILSYQQAGRDV